VLGWEEREEREEAEKYRDVGSDTILMPAKTAGGPCTIPNADLPFAFLLGKFISILSSLRLRFSLSVLLNEASQQPHIHNPLRCSSTKVEVSQSLAVYCGR
jgi:hypothetical protein